MTIEIRAYVECVLYPFPGTRAFSSMQNLPYDHISQQGKYCLPICELPKRNQEFCNEGGVLYCNSFHFDTRQYRCLWTHFFDIFPSILFLALLYHFVKILVQQYISVEFQYYWIVVACLIYSISAANRTQIITWQLILFRKSAINSYLLKTCKKQFGSIFCFVMCNSSQKSL